MESDLPDEIVVERALGGKISLVDASQRPNQRLVTEHVVASLKSIQEPKRLSILRERPKFSGRLSLPTRSKSAIGAT